MRLLIDEDPFGESGAWHVKGKWPAFWIAPQPRFVEEPKVWAYRRLFTVDERTKVRVHVSADERYELFLDGKRIGRGPERGDRLNWFYESYELDLAPGAHSLVARAWWLGEVGPAPYAQMTERPGFLLAAEGEAGQWLSTGVAAWQVKELPGYAWLPKEQAWGTGARVQVKGSEFDWSFKTGEGEGWREAAKGTRAQNQRANDAPRSWRLRPAMLPAMREERLHLGVARHVQAVDTDQLRQTPVCPQEHLAGEAEGWNALLAGKAPLAIPPHVKRRVIVDLENYWCAYPEVITTGGAGSRVRVHWAESLYTRAPKEGEGIEGMPKANRDQIEGRIFNGVGDVFEPDGGAKRVFETLWWECGRYVEIYVETAGEPLTIDELAFRDTGYPYEFESRFEASDARFAPVNEIALRALQMCSHETYMDCPYYEQLQYVGDTRLQALVTYATTRDDNLPRKALEMFDASRVPGGFTFSRYPSNVTQFIPPFSAWWIGMVYDHAMWRGNLDLVKRLMPGVRGVLDAFRANLNSDGLLVSPEGWNYFDWIGDLGDVGIGTVHGLYNLQLALAATYAEALERMIDEPDMADRHRRLAMRVLSACGRSFWSERDGLFADDMAKTQFSEHAQCLALLTGMMPASSLTRIAEGLLAAHDLTRTTIYFTHYLFEAYRMIGRIDRLVERLGLWFVHSARGMKTTMEAPEPTRSDCHAWGAHPVYHYYASILGIRPASPGFATVEVKPALGPLEWAKGDLVHPKGGIHAEFAVREGATSGLVVLPEGVTGRYSCEGKTLELKPGENRV